MDGLKSQARPTGPLGLHVIPNIAVRHNTMDLFSTMTKRVIHLEATRDQRVIIKTLIGQYLLPLPLLSATVARDACSAI